MGNGAETERAEGIMGMSEEIALPPASISGCLEKILAGRRSVREFTADSLTQQELSQLLWAAQGITSTEGLRTAPSAGATYPLEIYAAIKRAKGLTPGVYHYLPSSQALERVSAGDPTAELSLAAPQECVREGAVAVIISAVESRTAARYGDRARRYVQMEAGHAAQNVLLQAEALGLGAVPVGAFDDANLQSFLKTQNNVYYILSIGKPRK